MNWDAIGAIAEALGAVGVIATLLFLSFQFRQSARATQAENTRETLRSLGTINERIEVKIPWARKYAQGERDLVVLAALHNYLGGMFDAFESAWIARKSGSIDREYIDRFLKRQVPSVLCNAVASEVWIMVKDSYDPEFVGYFESLNDESIPKQTMEQYLDWDAKYQEHGERIA